MHRNTDTAIVFSGEYRTFPVCRKTMRFLEQQVPYFDIYVSTWNISTTVNRSDLSDPLKYSNRDSYTRDVAASEIKHSLNQCRAVKIHNFVTHHHTEAPMISHWKWGLDLVKQSGKKYGYILLLRPDLFFSPNSFFDIGKFSLFEKGLGICNGDSCVDAGGIHPVNQTKVLPDTVLFSTADNVFNFVYGFDNAKFCSSKLGWHEYLYSYATVDLNLEIRKIPITGETAIGRFGIDETWTIGEVANLYYRTMQTFQ